jgi:cytochrome c-type biogenesis protein CcmH
LGSRQGTKTPLIPAQAGTQTVAARYFSVGKAWVPACAGMSGWWVLPRLLQGLAAILLLATVLGSGANAVTPDEVLKDPALEARARVLSEGLRCLVCQNQSIDDSDAPLAHDIRVLLRERIAAGDSDQAVVAYLVARYGEFILLRPRFNLHTVILWATPPAVLLIGAAVALGLMRRRSRAAPPVALNGAEKARLDELLAKPD